MNKNSRERFEDRLLVALRDVVEERAAVDTAPVDTVNPARWRPRLVLAAGAVVLGIAGAVVLPSLVGEDSAYAVETHDDGTISVEIKQLSDAEGLERRLAELGIPAEVDYLPDGKVCQQPRYTSAQGGSAGGSGGSGERRGGSSASFSLRPSDFSAGRTLVIATAGRHQLSSIEFGVAEGPVSPCVPIDATEHATQIR